VLDDDCLPIPGAPNWDTRAFIAGHLDALQRPPAWASSVPGVRLRGLPYGGWGHIAGVPVLVHMGLWTGVPDLDAVQTLAHAGPASGNGHRGPPAPPHFEPPRGVRLMPAEQYFPFCGMHFCFRKEALPALYFPKMGENSPYARFDDIWCGL